MIRLVIVTGIVIAIVLIIMAIAIPLFKKYQREASKHNNEYDNYPEN